MSIFIPNMYKRIINREVVFSTSLLTSAAILTFTLHECGHAFFIKLYSLPGTLYQNRVDFDFTKANKQELIWFALGGSIFSLFQFIVFYPISIKLRSKNRFIQLLLTWLAIWSAVQLFGYLFIGLFPVWDDIFIIYSLLKVNYLIRIFISVSAFMLLTVTTRKLVKPMSYAIFSDFSPSPSSQANTMILVPSLFSIFILLALSLNSKILLSVIYPLSTPFLFLSLYFKVKKSQSLPFYGGMITKGNIICAGLLFILCIGLSIILSTGIKF